MSGEFTFIIGLFLSGLAVNCLAFRKLPSWVIISTAFFVGAFNWVLVSFLCLVILNGANPLYISISLISESLLCIVIIIRRRKEYSLKWNSLFLLIIYFILFIGLDYLFVRINLTNASRDTLTYIAMGKEMEFHGLANFLWVTPASIAYFASLMQTPSRFLGVDYLQNIQPMLSASFLLFLLASAYFYFGEQIGRVRSIILITFLGLFIFSSKLMQYMFAYIHSNNSSAYFLFLALFCFFAFSENSHEKSWLSLGAIFISGLCMLRVENTLVCILFLILASNILKLSHKDNIRYVLPCIFFALFIDVSYLVLIFLNSTKSILDSTQIIIIVAFEVFIAVYYLFKKMRLLDRLLRKYLDWIVPISAVIALFFTFATKPTHMLESFLACISNLFVTGGWGATWFVAFLSITFLWKRNRCEFSSILKCFIPLYFSVVFLLSYFRAPYHAAWSDSANRIFVQIFFVCIFFIIINLVKELKKDPLGSRVAPQPAPKGNDQDNKELLVEEK